MSFDEKITYPGQETLSSLGGEVTINQGKGEILASRGLIGGWNIVTDTLKDASGNVGMSSAVTGADDIRFWAGGATPADAPFSVSEAGILKANKVLSSGLEVVVEVGESLQDAINSLVATGGRIKLSNGVHTITEDIYLSSSVYLNGDSAYGCNLDFGGLYNMYIVGSDPYSTGTVSVDTFGTTVTGLGTSWLTNATVGQKIYLGNTYYNIIDVVSDTEITTDVPFAGDTIAGGNYVLATTIDDIEVNYINILNLADKIDINYAYNTFLSADTIISPLGAGLTINNSSNMGLSQDTVIGAGGTFAISNSGQLVIDYSGAIYSADDGVTFTNCSDVRIKIGGAYGCIGNGLVFDTCNNLNFDGASQYNGADGVLIKDCTAVTDNGMTSRNNIGNGITVDGSTNTALVVGAITGNVAYGISVTATSTNTLIANKIVEGNGDPILDLGTDTRIIGCIGIADFPALPAETDPVFTAWDKDYADLSNKPTLGTASAKNIPATGDASVTEVVYGSDTRLHASGSDNQDLSGLIAKTTNITALNETGIANGEIAVFNLTNKDIRTSDKTIVTTLGGDDTTVPTSKAVSDAMAGAGGGDFMANGSVPMTGLLTLKTGSTTVAPLKMVAGTNLTTAVAGTLEFSGTDLYFTV